MPFTATTMLLVGAGVSAVGAISAGQAEKDASDFQSTDQVMLAARERQIGLAEEEDFRRETSFAASTNRAAQGGSGVQLGTGSTLAAAGDHAAETEFQAKRIRDGAATSSTRLIQQAQLTRESGKAAKTRGFFRAGSSLLSGASKAFS
jgi:hypothetical protein